MSHLVWQWQMRPDRNDPLPAHSGQGPGVVGSGGWWAAPHLLHLSGSSVAPIWREPHVQVQNVMLMSAP